MNKKRQSGSSLSVRFLNPQRDDVYERCWRSVDRSCFNWQVPKMDDHYYTNKNNYSLLTPKNIPQPSGKIYVYKKDR